MEELSDGGEEEDAQRTSDHAQSAQLRQGSPKDSLAQWSRHAPSCRPWRLALRRLRLSGWHAGCCNRLTEGGLDVRDRSAFRLWGSDWVHTGGLTAGGACLLLWALDASGKNSLHDIPFDVGQAEVAALE